MTRLKISPSLGILIVLLLWTISEQLTNSLKWGHDSYQISEWLINYSGGFVRRGLPGTVIQMLADSSGIQANYLLIGFSLACFLFLTFWFLRSSTRTFPAILLLSCIIMGFPAYQDSIIRKDCLGLVFLLACLKIDSSRWPRLISIISINLIAILAILSHESFVFYGLPALVLFRHRNSPAGTILDCFKKALCLLPAAACFGIVSLYLGNPEIAKTINLSWLPLWQKITPVATNLLIPYAAIEALGWNAQQGLSLSLTLLTSGFYQPTAWLMVFAMATGLFLLFVGRDETRPLESKIRVAALLLVQWMCIAPLFILGIDYGRWLFLWMASTVMLDTEQRMTAQWLENGIAQFFNKLKIDTLLIQNPARDWYLLFFGVPVCWNILNFMTASPICRYLYQIYLACSK